MYMALASISLGMKAQQLAFPGAEGFGAYATGGRGGNVVHVTNLNDSGAGSLAEAVSKPGRIVVFDVGGVIDITKSNLTIASNITIAGQTAPGEGITLYGGRIIASGKSNIIIRYVRMRGSIAMNRSKATLTLDNCDKVILDHCSISWGRWDNVHIKDATNITWQNCIISEGIDPQRFGAITDGTTNWTVAHCLWANNKSRNPKMKCGIQYYNNVVYNYANGIVGGHSSANHYQDVIANYFITGPNSGSSNKYFDQWTETDHLYSKDNYTDANNDGVLNGSLITDYNGATSMELPNFNATHPINLMSAEEAYYDIVENAGASRVRDAHDKRIIEQLTSLGVKGAFIDDENDVGGIGTLASGSALKDSDGDGMPDEWENANGTDKTKNDANEDTNGDGYTNIETYINSLAQKSDFLLPPANVKAKLADETTVLLIWTTGDDEIEKTIVEQSEDGNKFEQIASLGQGVNTFTVNRLVPNQVYFYRLKVIKGGKESSYSSVVRVNDDFMKAGGGIPADTKMFIPGVNNLYRIINYATKAFNSSTTLDGSPKYLCFANDGALGATENFEWNNPALLWDIQVKDDDPTAFTIKNMATGKYLSPGYVSIDGVDKVGAADTAAVFHIEYTGNGKPKQSGMPGQISLFRITSPTNNGQQIRPKDFTNNWIWGNGTLDRADMVFTFSKVGKSLLSLYLNQLEDVISQADRTLSNAIVGDVTLGYPVEAQKVLARKVKEGKAFLAEAASDSKAFNQTQVDSVVTVVNDAVAEFKKTQILTFAGYDAASRYNIFSYGTKYDSRTEKADAATGRRYLVAIKTQDGQTDSLMFKVAPSDTDLERGVENPIAQSAEAQWRVSDANEGMVYLKNCKTGTYLQVDNTLSVSPVSVYPFYAAEDNSKHAFYIEASKDDNRCLNVGATDATGLQGNLYFASPANRTRLRWLFEEVEGTTSLVRTSIVETTKGSKRYYNLQGMEVLNPVKGMYIEQTIDYKGNRKSRVILKK